MLSKVPIAQIDRIGILVPDKPVIDIGTTPADPSQVEDLAEEVGLGQQRRQVDRWVELARCDVIGGYFD